MTETTCSCSFFKSFHLPCTHIAVFQSQKVGKGGSILSYCDWRWYRLKETVKEMKNIQIPQLVSNDENDTNEANETNEKNKPGSPKKVSSNNITLADIFGTFKMLQNVAQNNPMSASHILLSLQNLANEINSSGIATPKTKGRKKGKEDQRFKSWTESNLFIYFLIFYFVIF